MMFEGMAYHSGSFSMCVLNRPFTTLTHLRVPHAQALSPNSTSLQLVGLGHHEEDPEWQRHLQLFRALRQPFLLRGHLLHSRLRLVRAGIRLPANQPDGS